MRVNVITRLSSINSYTMSDKYAQSRTIPYRITDKNKRIDMVSFTSCKDIKESRIGASYNEQTQELEFSVMSKNATKINLCIYDKPLNSEAKAEIALIRNNNGKWSVNLDKESQKKYGINSEAPIYYGYRAWGPNWEYTPDWKKGSELGLKCFVDENGNRFNPNKLLTDPYAREISHDPLFVKDEISNTDYERYTTGKKNYCDDTEKFAPKSIFVKPDKSISTGKKPERDIKDDIIYEVHLKGFTKSDETIPEQYRGTYKGAGMKAKYLKDLGVTMVEFLPIQEFQNDTNDYGIETNYWGYMTNGFFAPDRHYAYDKSAGGPTKEFKEMVKAFHDEGIKVCMDVVYSHTGEGGIWGADKEDTATLLSLRGLDGGEYYQVSKDGKFLGDNSGCGANLNFMSKLVNDLCVDSTKFWAEEMGVDAFRHDLAPVLGNTVVRPEVYRNKSTGEIGDTYFKFDPKRKGGYFETLKQQCGIKSGTTSCGMGLIAEPWACGNSGSTFVGAKFPREWMEWSDGFRESVKWMFQCPKNEGFAGLKNVIMGQPFHYQGKETRAINYVSCHDGRTLNDIFEYSIKKETASDKNQSGKKSFDERLKSIKNSLLTMMISKGTPMILGGDERLRTQNGAENPYNVDGYYLDWQKDVTKDKMVWFVKKIIEFRKAHNSLRNNLYYNQKDNNNNGIKDISWFKEDATEVDEKYLQKKNNEFTAFRIDGTEFDDISKSIYVAFNKFNDTKSIKLPDKIGKNTNWYFVGDTDTRANWFDNFSFPEEETKMNGNEYSISPNSIMVFIEK